MKRDNDFIRELLLEVEASEEWYFVSSLTMSSSEEDLNHHYHAEMLCDAGLLFRINEGVYRITNQGHDYIEAIRSDKIWKKTKDSATLISGATLEIMKEIAISCIKSEAKSKLGINL